MQLELDPAVTLVNTSILPRTAGKLRKGLMLQVASGTAVLGFSEATAQYGIPISSTVPLVLSAEMLASNGNDVWIYYTDPLDLRYFEIY